MPWSALGSAALGVGSSGINSAIGYYFDKKLMAKQFEYQKEVLQNQVQWRVKDLRNAGINPMLAGDYQGTASAGVTIPSGKEGDIDILKSISAAKQFALQDEQLKTQQAQTLKTNAEAYESYERTWNAQVQRKIQEAQLPSIQAEALLKASQAQFLSEYPMLWKAAMVGNSANDALSPFIDGASTFVDAWLKNKGIDTFGNKQPPNHKPYDHETTFIGSDGKVKSKKRVRYK